MSFEPDIFDDVEVAWWQWPFYMVEHVIILVFMAATALFFWIEEKLR